MDLLTVAAIAILFFSILVLLTAYSLKMAASLESCNNSKAGKNEIQCEDDLVNDLTDG